MQAIKKVSILFETFAAACGPGDPENYRVAIL
jgi:hypothetical protein